jgi:predicted RNase H-like HicB family nuclease
MSNDDQTLQEKAIQLASRPYGILMSEDKLSDGTSVFVARVLEFPGLLVQEANPAEAVEELSKALIDYIYAMLQDGLEIPLPAEAVTAQRVIPSGVFHTYWGQGQTVRQSEPPDEESETQSYVLAWRFA